MEKRRISTYNLHIYVVLNKDLKLLLRWILSVIHQVRRRGSNWKCSIILFIWQQQQLTNLQTIYTALDLDLTHIAQIKKRNKTKHTRHACNVKHKENAWNKMKPIFFLKFCSKTPDNLLFYFTQTYNLINKSKMYISNKQKMYKHYSYTPPLH